MDPVLVALLGVIGGLAVGAVTFAYLSRRGAVKPSTDVDELAVEVERLGKAFRRFTMQRVRQAQSDIDLPVPAAQSVPPVAPVNPPLTPKDALRQRVIGR